MSERRREQVELRRTVEEFVRRRDRECQARRAVGGECAGRLDVHEVIPRSAWPDGYLEPDNCVLVCRAHHSWIDRHPTEAHGFGLHGYSWERP